MQISIAIESAGRDGEFFGAAMIIDAAFLGAWHGKQAALIRGLSFVIISRSSQYTLTKAKGGRCEWKNPQTSGRSTLNT
jgi:hypothetical protein